MFIILITYNYKFNVVYKPTNITWGPTLLLKMFGWYSSHRKIGTFGAAPAGHAMTSHRSPSAGFRRIGWSWTIWILGHQRLGCWWKGDHLTGGEDPLNRTVQGGFNMVVSENGGSPSQHGCFNTKSWSNDWMIWWYSRDFGNLHHTIQ